MSDPEDSERPKRQYGFSAFRGRRLAPLAGPWVSSAIFAALIYYAEYTMPALRDVAGLVYWLLLAIVAIATMRWLRIRGGDRRESDRRQSR